MKYMLDTNICIYAAQGGNEHLDRRLGECQTGDLVMSAITLGELEAGFANSGDAKAARTDASAVFGAVAVVPLEETAARAFGRIQSQAPGAVERMTAKSRRMRSRLA